MSTDCVFCRIATNEAPATVVREWDNAIAFVPLNPVAPGHTLVIPKWHVADFADDPQWSAVAMLRASELARELWGDGAGNLITSRGREATQSVFHLHLHLLPRQANDGLALPWYSGKRKAAAR